MVQQANISIEELAKKANRKIETVFHEVVQDLAFEVIKATPWETGFLRASWFPSINDPGKIPDGVTADPSGSFAISRIAAEVVNAKVGDTIYILNGANYAKFVEFGTSRMAPRAFVRGTVNRAPQIAKRTVERIKTEP